MKKIIETDMSVYNDLKQCLMEIYPQIKVELIDSDPALFNLGFVKEIPCTISVDATEEMIKEIMDIATDYEVDAYATPDGTYPKDDDPNYILYRKYGWLWDFFYYYFK